MPELTTTDELTSLGINLLNKVLDRPQFPGVDDPRTHFLLLLKVQGGGGNTYIPTNADVAQLVAMTGNKPADKSQEPLKQIDEGLALKQFKAALTEDMAYRAKIGSASAADEVWQELLRWIEGPRLCFTAGLAIPDGSSWDCIHDEGWVFDTMLMLTTRSKAVALIAFADD